MSTDQSPSAMQRKAGAGRPPPEIGAPTAARILRTAIMQAGEDVAALTIVAGQPEEARTTLEPIVEGIAENVLMALIEGPEGRYGLVLVDPDTLAALIEMQTTGRVVARPAVARAPTRTDAIMCADFIDRVLELLETRAVEADIAIAPALAGFRYALALSEPRAIPMTLDDVPYRRFHIPLDLGRGAKQGTLDLILPFDAAPSAQVATATGDPAGFTEALAEAVSRTEAHLRGTLHRMDMTLSEVAALTVGSVIAIPREALGQVAIEDIEGRVVMNGRLGMAGGHRAIRVGTAETGGEAGEALQRAPSPAALPVAETLGDLPSAPEPVAELAEIGDLPALGDLGDLGGGDDLGDLGELPDLPDLGDLGDLPDLPDLADL
ncbi:MAG: FliM/FliN family flagellar motor switch protein [Pseudomonadota bacterium]|nr:FliM/FliN family flagellar motor switch protein [Pseudomonadota bacterium]